MGIWWAIPSLPDPMKITCPYCGQVDSYPKGSIQSNIALGKINPNAWLIFGVAMVAMAVLAAILRFSR